MKKNSKIYVAGHNGMVGSAIINQLNDRGFNNIITIKSQDLDLRNQNEVEVFFKNEKPEYVFLAAASVGGILANYKFRGDFIYNNLMIQSNVIHQSYINGVKKLLFLGSTCIYPKNAPQPIRENSLLTSELEFSNEPYAIAKIAGLKMCESYNVQYGTNFISVMPTNLYGPNDNFDLESGHVLPALLRKIYLGKLLEEENYKKIILDLKKRPIKNSNNLSGTTTIIKLLEEFGIKKLKNNVVEVEIWGTGKPIREFLFSTECADACIFVMENIDSPEIFINKKEFKNTHINIGSGETISVKDLALMLKQTIGFKGNLKFNENKLDGTVFKSTEISKLKKLGWTSKIKLKEGVKLLLKFYKS